MNSPQPPRLRVETLLRGNPAAGVCAWVARNGGIRARSVRKTGGFGIFEPVAIAGLKMEHVTEFLG
jgi:hypothetical protein